MSVDRTGYLIVGYKFAYDIAYKNDTQLKDTIWEDKELIPMMEGAKGEDFTIVFDGMSGDYIVFGKAISRSDIYSGFDFIELNLNDDDYDIVKNKAKDLFADLQFEFTKPQLLLFSHYS